MARPQPRRTWAHLRRSRCPEPRAQVRRRVLGLPATSTKGRWGWAAARGRLPPCVPRADEGVKGLQGWAGGAAGCVRRVWEIAELNTETKKELCQLGLPLDISLAPVADELARVHQAAKRIRVPRPQAERTAEADDGFCQPPLLLVRQAEVAVRLGHVRLDGEHGLVAPHRLDQQARLPVGVAHAHVRLGEARVGAHRRRQMGEGELEGGRATNLLEEGAEVGVGSREAGIDSKRRLVTLMRLPAPAEQLERVALRDKKERRRRCAWPPATARQAFEEATGTGPDRTRRARVGLMPWEANRIERCDGRGLKWPSSFPAEQSAGNGSGSKSDVPSC
eukprot:scaffold3808_cov112-Isochrysis_galbana.AAC.47